MSAPVSHAGDVLIQGRFGDTEILPLPGAMGAEVRGLDLRTLDDTLFRIVHRAYLDHLLLVFRDQSLDESHMVAIAERFGELELPPVTAQHVTHSDRHPAITVVSNVRENGQPIGELGDGEVIWHSDYSFREIVVGMRLLYGIEVPPPGEGADTEFCNTYAAYDTLPPDLKAFVHGRTIKHDNAYDTNMKLRRGAVAIDDPRLGSGPDHPMVTTHPETGCNSLFLGRRPRHYINGCTLEDSERLLDRLWTHATQAAFQLRHQWRPRDAVLWDNRCTLHRRGAFNPAARRVMKAIQVKAHRPYEAPDATLRPAHPRAASGPVR